MINGIKVALDSRISELNKVEAVRLKQIRDTINEVLQIRFDALDDNILGMNVGKTPDPTNTIYVATLKPNIPSIPVLALHYGLAECGIELYEVMITRQKVKKKHTRKKTVFQLIMAEINASRKHSINH
jgi:hypothetical protein